MPDDHTQPPPANLAELRGQIDALDAEIVRLLSARGEVARAVGRVKAGEGAPVYSPDREKQVLERIAELNRGPFPASVLQAIYRELMSGSLSLERPPRIAVLGPRGSYSHMAALRKFGHAVEYEPVQTIASAFGEVERGHADLAVVPIENSLSGPVIDTLDAMMDTSAQICAELFQPIHHHLLARASIDRIVRVYSKPEVFDQCRTWLLETGLFHKTVAVSSTSRAAELAAAELDTAAIAGELAAELFGLSIQYRDIEDAPNNQTRFYVLARETAKRTGDDRTALRFDLPHRAGALADVLSEFRQHAVNLSLISSRPSRRRNWEYRFFLDCDGHCGDTNVAAAIGRARSLCTDLFVLGSFPRAVA